MIMSISKSISQGKTGELHFSQNLSIRNIHLLPYFPLAYRFMVSLKAPGLSPLVCSMQFAILFILHLLNSTQLNCFTLNTGIASILRSFSCSMHDQQPMHGYNHRPNKTVLTSAVNQLTPASCLPIQLFKHSISAQFIGFLHIMRRKRFSSWTRFHTPL